MSQFEFQPAFADQDDPTIFDVGDVDEKDDGLPDVNDGEDLFWAKNRDKYPMFRPPGASAGPRMTAAEFEQLDRERLAAHHAAAEEAEQDQAILDGQGSGPRP